MILKNKRKIRIIIGSLNVGGTENQLLKIINGLANKKWEIELIFLKEKGKLSKYLNEKIKISNLNVKSSIKFLSVFKIIFKLVNIFKKNPKTLTHFFLPQSYIVGMFSAMIARSKCKLLMSRRSLNYYQKKFFLYGIIEKFLHKKVDKILVNSDAIKKQLIKDENVEEGKIKIIYNGIEVKKELGFKEKNSFNIAIVANLIPYKNHHLLLNSLSLIKDKLPDNWKLYCIGRDDGIKKNLVELSKKKEVFNNIIWTETLNTKKLLEKCNLGILCSKEEGFPNAILEYFASKLCVITTDVGGCKEIVKNKINGLVVKNNDSLELSKAILYLYKNKKQAEKFCKEGYNTAKNKFGLKKTINEHEGIYLKNL